MNVRTATGPLTTAHEYLAAWNAHDGAAVARLFAPGGTYVDPSLPGPIPGEAVGGYVDMLVAAFPDLSFADDGTSVDGARVTAQWRMRGTNTGPLPGEPGPTNGTVDLPGVDVITVGAAGIESVVGYFDQKTMVEQLGMQALVIPSDEGPMHFGFSLRTDLGRTAVPGALSMTWADVADEAEEAELARRSEEVIGAFMEDPGFLGIVASVSGRRGHTLSAWTTPEAAVAAVARNRAHTEGMAEMMRAGGLARNGLTAIWVPWRNNGQMPRCTCGERVRITVGEESAVCGCGASVTVTSYL
ncbi:ester cyclase [Pseudonocardia hydrocarbonoxydans]|uniref:SnoaL-like domain-containing protein n=1 Tax=Pseudonocardia hydrocarbonoxydans TaxID=76726 RepID=A0A4Y3WPW4_9PSEU|nr:nuclear transport factor 2 family protein [Pseudonocardia hydrocarbonoxydans]GEC20855.1 hypothetical protein PHY01_31380 [Pseudonocardia hydrocarbonoxydans]